MTDQHPNQPIRTEYCQSKARLGLILGTELFVALCVLFSPAGRVFAVLLAVMSLAQIVSYYAIGIKLEKDHIVLTTGIISKETADVPYNKINTISVKQGLWGRFLGYGTIVIYTGNDSSGIKVVGIDEPNDLKRIVKKLMDR